MIKNRFKILTIVIAFIFFLFGHLPALAAVTPTPSVNDLSASSTRNEVVAVNVPANTYIQIYDSLDMPLAGRLNTEENATVIIEIDDILGTGDQLKVSYKTGAMDESDRVTITAEEDPVTAAPAVSDLMADPDVNKVTVYNVPDNTMVRVYRKGEATPLVSSTNTSGFVQC